MTPDLPSLVLHPATSLLVRAAISLLMLVETPYAEAQGVPPEQAAAPCAARKDIVAKLAERYGETLQSIGLNRDNGLMEVYASEKTGSWTILLTKPDGLACLVASGGMWEPHAGPHPGEDA